MWSGISFALWDSLNEIFQWFKSLYCEGDSGTRRTSCCGTGSIKYRLVESNFRDLSSENEERPFHWRDVAARSMHWITGETHTKDSLKLVPVPFNTIARILCLSDFLCRHRMAILCPWKQRAVNSYVLSWNVYEDPLLRSKVAQRLNRVSKRAIARPRCSLYVYLNVSYLRGR